eukprot:4173357-Alexandrium_andersonii.AAC.1
MPVTVRPIGTDWWSTAYSPSRWHNQRSPLEQIDVAMVVALPQSPRLGGPWANGRATDTNE